MGSTYTDILVRRMGVPAGDIVVYDVRGDRAKALSAKYGVDLSLEFPDKIDAAIVVVSTPAHAQVIVELCRRGVKKILCEKPLALDSKQVARIKAAMSDELLLLSLVMEFSPTMSTLKDFMRSHGVHALEMHGYFGKPRLLDKAVRPSPGVIDEVIHPIAYTLELLPARPQVINVFSRTTSLPFVDAAVQKEACQFDRSFPAKPSHAVCAMLNCHVGEATVPISMFSSFLLARQERQIGGILGRDGKPIFSFLVDLDMRNESGYSDKLTIADLTPRRRHVTRTFPGIDKLRYVAEAFLVAARGGEIDPRLAPFGKASLLVEINDALERSSKRGTSQRVLVC